MPTPYGVQAAFPRVRSPPGTRYPRQRFNFFNSLSINLKAQQIIVQLLLLLGFGPLESLDLLAQRIDLGLLLVEFFDVPSIELGVLSEPGHILADAGLFLGDLVDALFPARPPARG